MLFLLTLSCSDNDDNSCYPDRTVIENHENLKGIVTNSDSQCPSSLFILRTGIDPEGRAFVFDACNLPESFETDGQPIIFSGKEYATGPLEDVCAFPFEISDIDAYASENELYGIWQLVKFTDTSTMAETVQNDKEKPIEITFYETNYNGSTTRNQFFGVFMTEGNNLILKELNTTEVAESEWGNRFYDSLQKLYSTEEKHYLIPYSITMDTLKFEYEPSKFMVLANKRF